VSFSFKGVICR